MIISRPTKKIKKRRADFSDAKNGSLSKICPFLTDLQKPNEMKISVTLTWTIKTILMVHLNNQTYFQKFYEEVVMPQSAISKLTTFLKTFLLSSKITI